MEQARIAARNLMNKIYDGTLTEKPDNEYIRVGFVPFSGAVRLDTAGYDFSMDWIDTTGAAVGLEAELLQHAPGTISWPGPSLTNRPWNGCVEARWGDYATDDTAPVSGNTLFTPYFAPDEPTYSNSTLRPTATTTAISARPARRTRATGITTSNCSGWSSSRPRTSNLTAARTTSTSMSAKSITAESSSRLRPLVQLRQDQGRGPHL